MVCMILVNVVAFSICPKYKDLFWDYNTFLTKKIRIALIRLCLRPICTVFVVQRSKIKLEELFVSTSFPSCIASVVFSFKSNQACEHPCQSWEQAFPDCGCLFQGLEWNLQFIPFAFITGTLELYHLYLGTLLQASVKQRIYILKRDFSSLTEESKLFSSLPLPCLPSFLMPLFLSEILSCNLFGKFISSFAGWNAPCRVE